MFHAESHTSRQVQRTDRMSQRLWESYWILSWGGWSTALTSPGSQTGRFDPTDLITKTSQRAPTGESVPVKENFVTYVGKVGVCIVCLAWWQSSSLFVPFPSWSYILSVKGAMISLPVQEWMLFFTWEFHLFWLYSVIFLSNNSSIWVLCGAYLFVKYQMYNSTLFIMQNMLSETDCLPQHTRSLSDNIFYLQPDDCYRLYH